METYIIRVNGIEYEVEVEKKAEGQSASAAVQPEKKAQPPKAEVKTPVAEGQPVTCGTAGKVWKLVAAEGAELKKGDTILILEAMKMEIPVVAPFDGTLASIQAAEGDSVAAGQTVATIA